MSLYIRGDRNTKFYSPRTGRLKNSSHKRTAGLQSTRRSLHGSILAVSSFISISHQPAVGLTLFIQFLFCGEIVLPFGLVLLDVVFELFEIAFFLERCLVCTFRLPPGLIVGMLAVEDFVQDSVMVL